MIAVGIVILIAAVLAGIWIGLRRAIIRLVAEEEMAISGDDPGWWGK